jgi:hypothetical protein
MRHDRLFPVDGLEHRDARSGHETAGTLLPRRRSLVRTVRCVKLQLPSRYEIRVTARTRLQVDLISTDYQNSAIHSWVPEY